RNPHVLYLPLLPYTTLFRSRCCRAVIFENGVADRDALVANVGPGIVARGRDQLGNGVLRLVAERAAQNFFSSGPVFHSAQLLLVDRKSTRLNSSQLVNSYAV